MTVAVQTTTAVGYFRVSSPGQAGERHVSLEAQTTQFNDYCRAHGLDPIATFTDVPVAVRMTARNTAGCWIT